MHVICPEMVALSEEHHPLGCRLHSWVGEDGVLHLVPLSWSNGDPRVKALLAWQHPVCFLGLSRGACDEQLASCILAGPPTYGWASCPALAQAISEEERQFQGQTMG